MIHILISICFGYIQHECRRLIPYSAALEFGDQKNIAMMRWCGMATMIDLAAHQRALAHAYLLPDHEFGLYSQCCHAGSPKTQRLHWRQRPCQVVAETGAMGHFSHFERDTHEGFGNSGM
jgi:hypothetical protein